MTNPTKNQCVPVHFSMTHTSIAWRRDMSSDPTWIVQSQHLDHADDQAMNSRLLVQRQNMYKLGIGLASLLSRLSSHNQRECPRGEMSYNAINWCIAGYSHHELMVARIRSSQVSASVSSIGILSIVVCGIRVSPALTVLANCLIYLEALTKYVIVFCCWSCGCVLLARGYHPWHSRKKRCSFSLFSMKNAKIVQLWV